jgi:hypothetical protein
MSNDVGEAREAREADADPEKNACGEGSHGAIESDPDGLPVLWDACKWEAERTRAPDRGV